MSTISSKTISDLAAYANNPNNIILHGCDTAPEHFLPNFTTMLEMMNIFKKSDFKEAFYIVNPNNKMQSDKDLVLIFDENVKPGDIDAFNNWMKTTSTANNIQKYLATFSTGK